MAVSFIRRARFVGDDRRIVNLAVSSTGFATAIAVGDLVFIDPAGSPTLTDAGTGITFTDLGDAGTKAQNQVRAAGGFAGVAVSRGASAGATIQVGAGGNWQFPCTSGTYVAGQLVGPEGTGSAGAVGVSSTTLVGVDSAAKAIGRVTRGGTTVTTIEVEIKSRIFGGTVPEADIVATTLTTSGDVTVGGNIVAVGITAAGNGVTLDGATVVSGRLYSAQAAPDAESATTQTYSAAELLGGIITSTQTGAVTGTVSTGALLDDATLDVFSLGTDKSFDWCLINLGSSSGAVTVTAATGHTLVGNMVVAISTSGLFRSRRTAADTWITYRLAG